MQITNHEIGIKRRKIGKERNGGKQLHSDFYKQKNNQYFKDGLDKINLLTPGEIYEFEIEMTGTANVFQPGHRIRVDITSSNFPQFDRNPNTGHPLGSSSETRIANQTIYHGSLKPSHILLPTVAGF